MYFCMQRQCYLVNEDNKLIKERDTAVSASYSKSASNVTPKLGQVLCLIIKQKGKNPEELPNYQPVSSGKWKTQPPRRVSLGLVRDQHYPPGHNCNLLCPIHCVMISRDSKKEIYIISYPAQNDVSECHQQTNYTSSRINKWCASLVLGEKGNRVAPILERQRAWLLKTSDWNHLLRMERNYKIAPSVCNITSVQENFMIDGIKH